MIYDPRPKLKELLEKKALSHSTLAHSIGLSKTAVDNWFNEKDSMPTIPTLESICLLFNISMIDFFINTDINNLNAKQINLLDLFAELSPQQQDSIIEIIKTLISCNKA